MNRPPPVFTVYSRAWCHLCDDMINGLRELQAGGGFELKIVDVDSDPALEARYGELVPALVAADGEICHYHLDAARVHEYLNR